MENLHQFLKYAAAFEQTLADDDWSRLTSYFAEDSSYRVEGPPYDCEIHGREEIFRGIKKSLDGFDRKFSGRDVEVTHGPDLDGDELRLGWAVTYKKDGFAPFVLRGHSTVRYRDGKIVHILDRFDPETPAQLADWQSRHDIQLDPAYT